MSATRLGQLLFALGFAVLGVLSLIYDDFAMVWQPVPAGIPGRAPLADASGLMLVAGGIGMLVRRTVKPATMLLGINLVLWLLLLRLPPLLATPGVEARWLGFGETLVLVIGAWALLAAVAPQGPLAGAGRIRVARLLFGLALLMIGLSHFFYLEDTASLVPDWLPLHNGFAYFTGAAHLAAGLGILFSVLPRLAATAEAGMISAFTLLVWIPRLATDPGSRLQWTAQFMGWALSGAAWSFAGSYGDRRGFEERSSAPPAKRTGRQQRRGTGPRQVPGTLGE